MGTKRGTRRDDSREAVEEKFVNPEPMLLALADGDWDEHLDALHRALRERRSFVSSISTSQSLAQLSPGDIVRFNSKIRNKDLVGVTARVEKRLVKNVSITLLQDTDKWPAGTHLRCSPGMFDKVEDDKAAAQGVNVPPTPVKQSLASFKVGDMVRINNQARPQYLRGTAVKIVGIKGGKFLVVFQKTVRHYKRGMEIPCPASILEKI